MKEKKIVTLLVLVLVALIFRLGMKKLDRGLTNQSDQEENMQVIKIMAEMENECAYEEMVKEYAESNEALPYSLEVMLVENGEDTANSGDAVLDSQSGSSTSERIESNEKLPEYSNLYPDLYVDKISPKEVGEEEKIAYLTFDDGPSENTTKILDILEEKEAVATFFVLGSTMTEEGEDALRRMVEMDCKIGIHTYSHKKDVIYSSISGFLDDFNKVYTQVYEITGEKPNIFRFPWGSYNSYSKGIKSNLVAEMERRGFTYYDWNVSAEDSVGTPTCSSIMKNIMKDVKKYNQPVILMHDSCVNDLTVTMLPTIIDTLKEMGFSFGTLDEREPCQFCY